VQSPIPQPFLDYFFRGRLEITEAVPVLRNHSIKYIKVDAKNITPTKEALTDGEFTVSCRYTPKGKNLDGSEDKFASSTPYPCASLDYNQEMTWMFFTFINPIPEDATIKKITLAYKGKLGEEDNAVIGAVETFDNGSTEYRFGETIFGEEWDDKENSLTKNHPWIKNMSADIGGTAYADVESGILKQSNKRDAGNEEGRYNVTLLKLTEPLHIGNNAFLQFKFDEMKEIPNGSPDYSQYLRLMFSNNTSLMFTYEGGVIYAHSGAAYYKFIPGYIILGNIFDLLQNQQKTVTEPETFYLTDILIAQEMYKLSTSEDVQFEQYLESDFISIVEGMQK